MANRVQNDSELLFILNHSSETLHLPLKGSYQDILTGIPKSGDLTLSAYEVLILRKKGTGYVSSR